jgi:hypothetical protein
VATGTGYRKLVFTAFITSVVIDFWKKYFVVAQSI